LAYSVDAIVSPDRSHSRRSPPKNSGNSTGTKTGQQSESLEGIGSLDMWYYSLKLGIFCCLSPQMKHYNVLKLPMILEVFEEELISGNNKNHVSLGSH